MNISINQFEQYIDETILARGLSYFKNGYVSEPEEIRHGVYEAIVAGSEDYTVALKIKNGTVLEHVCTCPYDMGPVCKHVVAVLFYLQHNVLEQEQNSTPLHTDKDKTITKKIKKNTVVEQIDEMLEKITEAELKQFVSEKAKYNPSFRNMFLSSFAHKNANESKVFYANQVKSILRTAAGGENFIYWDQASGAGIAVSELLTTAQRHLGNKNYKSAIFICTAVMEEMTEALQFADDSNGDIGGTIDFAFNLLSDITKEKLPEEIRVLLFEYCLMAFEKCTYSEWDWNLGVLHIASEIFKSETEAQQIITHLDKIQHSEYEKEEAQYIKFNIIKKINGEREADKFIEQNLSNSKLRREAIARSLKNKDHEKAIKISKDGIKQHEKDKPGLAMEWYDWLLKIAQAQKDKERIIEYARLLFVDNFRKEQDYYQLLRTNVQPEIWTVFIEEIINDIQKKHRFDFDLIANIFIKEQWWSRLLELIKKNASLSCIERYEKYLTKNYTNEIVDLYERCILEFMKVNTGRHHYKTTCKYLKRMIKLGAKKKVNDIIEFLKKEYAQRRALIEELRLV